MIATQISRPDVVEVAQPAIARRPYRDMAIAAIVLITAALFLFLDARPMPILLWDESRNMVNALEMDRAGYSLMTTYQGLPDLWNTKPPLMIWLMVASLRLFGSSEWALRLPGMVASLGTLAIVMLFVRRATGSIWTGALAATLLVISPALLGEHGARTADYDSLLTFFVTAYLVLLFAAIHRVRPKPRHLALIAGCLIGAMLTKSIAGAIPGFGVGAYMLLTQRVDRLWRGWGYVVAAIAIVMAIGLFLTLREVRAPGYISAMWYNDVGGRFSQALETERKSPFFYLADLWAGYFSATLLLILSPIAIRGMSGRSRAVILYGLSVSVTFLAIISVSASKLHHYVLPILPIMAIVAAITFRSILSRLGGALREGRSIDRIAAVALALLAVVPLTTAAISAVPRRYVIDPPYEGAASRRYGPLFERLVRQPLPVTVVDTGAPQAGEAHYVAVLRAYRLLWQRRGVAIGWSNTLDFGKQASPVIIASCKPDIVPMLLAHGIDIGGIAGCAAITRQ